MKTRGIESRLLRVLSFFFSLSFSLACVELNPSATATATATANPILSDRTQPTRSYLDEYKESSCPDYTGQPLQDCEAGSFEPHALCELIFSYSLKCQEAHKCNCRFPRTKICGAASDFKYDCESAPIVREKLPGGPPRPETSSVSTISFPGSSPSKRAISLIPFDPMSDL